MKCCHNHCNWDRRRKKAQKNFVCLFVGRCITGMKNWSASTAKQLCVRSVWKNWPQSVYIVIFNAARIA
eukprot:15310112-Ditylum_brightwellii.AAC.1